MAAIKPPSMPGHSCECLCENCERNGTGYFAQRAALQGNGKAAALLSQAVFAALSAQREQRRRVSHKRRAG